MSEIKWTPGEWEVDASGYRAPGGGLCVMAGDLCIAVVAGDSDKPQAENASLIAAAPELLEALQIIIGDIEQSPRRFSGSQKVAVAVARAAILKATGAA